jgi:hypothetical protein
MSDDDILLWSEQQAATIRELGRTRRDLPNELSTFLRCFGACSRTFRVRPEKFAYRHVLH